MPRRQGASIGPATAPIPLATTFTSFSSAGTLTVTFTSTNSPFPLLRGFPVFVTLHFSLFCSRIPLTLVWLVVE